MSLSVCRPTTIAYIHQQCQGPWVLNPGQLMYHVIPTATGTGSPGLAAISPRFQLHINLGYRPHVVGPQFTQFTVWLLLGLHPVHSLAWESTFDTLSPSVLGWLVALTALTVSVTLAASLTLKPEVEHSNVTYPRRHTSTTSPHFNSLRDLSVTVTSVNHRTVNAAFTGVELFQTLPAIVIVYFYL